MCVCVCVREREREGEEKREGGSTHVGDCVCVCMREEGSQVCKGHSSEAKSSLRVNAIKLIWQEETNSGNTDLR